MARALILTLLCICRASGAGDDANKQAPRLLDPDASHIGRMVADLTVRTVDGMQRQLSDFGDRRALSVVFYDDSCPVSKRLQPTLIELEAAYAERGIAFLFVNVHATIDEEQAAAAHPFSGPLIHDPELDVAAAFGALTSTDVFVLDRRRTLVYRGAVDDQYGIGYSRAAPRATYLRDALDAVLIEEPVRVPATWAPGCVLDVVPSDVADPEITYHNRISRIVDRDCLVCHRAGGVAPFPLETLDDVRAKRGMIGFVLESSTMPPWFAAAGSGPWSNDRTLPAEDKADLLDWIEAGTPEGNPEDAPLPSRFTTGWSIGEPDVVFTIPQDIEVQADGVVPYIFVAVQTNYPEDRWVVATEIRPTSLETVHHVLVHVDTRDGAQLAQGDWRGLLASYLPGQGSRVYPKGMARRLPARAKLQFQLHYTPNGRATVDRTELGLVFSDGPPEHEVISSHISNTEFVIPPYAPSYEVIGEQHVPFDGRLLSLMPHMHYRGKAFRIEVIRPDQSQQLLLDVPRYDFNWQTLYEYSEPMPVVAGSCIRVTGWFDNSSDNPANPDPSREVRWGQQSTEEMMMAFVDYYLEPGS